MKYKRMLTSMVKKQTIHVFSGAFQDENPGCLLFFDHKIKFITCADGKVDLTGISPACPHIFERKD